ncbi:MAG TPA: hypothetical protein PKJ08_04710 [Candidatus Cloacimonadota bacterium]|nr:hypothetical protein [Candidatus Cloacimonadota bacterium]HOD53806.1 hypothetical protein [Candidatus Cloacimonadota bacterium]
MKVVIINDQKDVIYRITDKEGVSDELLQSMFYQLNGDFYEKRLPLEAMMFDHPFSEIEPRYNHFINRELIQRYNQKTLEDALLLICQFHKANQIDWWLAGSAALYIRGIDVQPHDLDIMTYFSEIEKIRKSFLPYIVEPFHRVKSWVVKGFGVIDTGIRTDYAFEPEAFVDNEGYVDFGPYAESHLEIVNWKGYDIFVPPVELHLKSNLIRNRIETVEKIKKYKGDLND